MLTLKIWMPSKPSPQLSNPIPRIKMIANLMTMTKVRKKKRKSLNHSTVTITMTEPWAPLRLPISKPKTLLLAISINCTTQPKMFLCKPTKLLHKLQKLLIAPLEPFITHSILLAQLLKKILMKLKQSLRPILMQLSLLSLLMPQLKKPRLKHRKRLRL